MSDWEDFERSVFINCPFDEDYQPILQAMLFCIVYLGFQPRIGTESLNSADIRLEKIALQIEQSRFSIHDLSRSQAKEAGEFYRLNMPFEYGIDWACRKWRGGKCESKRFLILDEQKHRYLAALSDIAGSDIAYHSGNFQVAVRKVRNWLVSEANIQAEGASRILARYADFQGWYYERQLAAGFSEDDIEDYPTAELLSAMFEWRNLGEPLSL
jgi:hypothetical protein